MPNKKQARKVFELLGALHEVRAIGKDCDAELELRGPLARAFAAGTELMSAALGSAATSATQRALAARDLEGLTHVYVQHGLLSIANARRDEKALFDFREALSEACKLDRAEGRRSVNELLDRTHLADPFVKRVNRAIDRVNLGTLPWEKFVARFQN